MLSEQQVELLSPPGHVPTIRLCCKCYLEKRGVNSQVTRCWWWCCPCSEGTLPTQQNLSTATRAFQPSHRAPGGHCIQKASEKGDWIWTNRSHLVSLSDNTPVPIWHAWLSATRMPWLSPALPTPPSAASAEQAGLKKALNKCHLSS